MRRVVRLVIAPVKWLWRLVAPQSAPPKVTKAEQTSSTPPGELEELGDAMKSIRDSLRTMGAAFAAAGGVVVGGLGYAQLHQAFPLPVDGRIEHGIAIASVALGAVLALSGFAYFAARFFTAQRRIPMQAKGVGVGLDATEKALRKATFDEDAQAEEAPSLHALELRALRLERIARRQPEGPLRASMEKEAARLNTAIRLTFRRAAAAILERRAHDVYSGGGTTAAISAFILGVVLLFGVADWAKGERDLIDLRAKCAEAEVKGAADACNPVRADRSVSDVPTYAEAAAQRQATMRTELVASCLRRVLRLAKGSEKEVIVAAITLCGGAKPG